MSLHPFSILTNAADVKLNEVHISELTRGAVLLTEMGVSSWVCWVSFRAKSTGDTFKAEVVGARKKMGYHDASSLLVPILESLVLGEFYLLRASILPAANLVNRLSATATSRRRHA